MLRRPWLMFSGEPKYFRKEVTIYYHICNRSTRKNESADDLADEVETAVLVRDGHDDADRYKENSGDRKSKQ